jgi:hypothetical protein
MNIGVLLAAVAGAITLFVLGYIIWGMLLGSYFKSNTIEYAGLSKQPMPNLVSLFLSNLALALLLAIVFEQWASIRTFGGGLVAGAIIGLLIHLSWKLSLMGYMNLYKEISPVVVDVLVETARASLAGGVIGAVLGLMNQNAKWGWTVKLLSVQVNMVPTSELSQFFRDCVAQKRRPTTVCSGRAISVLLKFDLVRAADAGR